MKIPFGIVSLANLFLLAALVTRPAVPSAAESSAASSPSQRPNILVILADDLGYGELSIQGNPRIPTPHIDALAKNGVRFTSGYVSGTYCSPTRAGLMTGRYQQRFGHEFNSGPAQSASTSFGLSLMSPASRTLKTASVAPSPPCFQPWTMPSGRCWPKSANLDKKKTRSFFS